MTDLESTIKQLRDGQSFIAPHTLGVIKISGPEAKDFLSRMSTADLSSLAVGQSKSTCFLNKLGRIIDRVLVIGASPDEYLLVSSFADGNKLLEWLEQFHFIEDFSLSLHDQAASLELRWTDQLPALLLWQSPAKDEFSLKISVGFQSNLRTLHQKAWESLRIAAAMPWAGYEISDRFMPQNIGLDADISADKGCYLGQEVIAKAITYQKNPKSLRGIKLIKKDWDSHKIGDRLNNSEAQNGEIISLSPCFIEGFINVLVLLDPRADKEQDKFIFNK